jgi:RNA polymerase sigma-70 factor (ECF subfamily)
VGLGDTAILDATVEIDRQLVHAMAGGSTDALGRLYDRHAPVVYGLACRVTGRPEDAEEVVQDVFTQIWKQAARYDPARATVAGWLVMIARARSLDRLRARRARPDQTAPADPAETAGLSAAGPTPEQIAISGREARLVRTALQGLPEAQRVLVELAFYDGLTHSEIAERTGTPLGTVKTRLRMAASALRGALNPATS